MGLIFSVLALVFTVHAKGPIQTLKLNEIFSVDDNPGGGKLVYTQGDKTEEIVFGAEPGHFGIGIIFDGDSLPDPYARDFKNAEILQIALGTVRTKIAAQVPQFGAATLVSRDAPLAPPPPLPGAENVNPGKKKKKKKDRTGRSYDLMVPVGGAPNERTMALLLFTSPGTPNEQTDEDKLKGTFFAQSGKITARPKGTPKLIGVRYQGKNVNFKAQMWSFEVKALLVTPFNAQENRLEGTLEFPVYWPSGREAEKLTKRIATESLGGMAPLPAKEGVPYNRDIAGSTKKK